jgi:hypothetical protein
VDFRWESAATRLHNIAPALLEAASLPEPTFVSGVIIAQGVNFGGWSVYFVDGKLRFLYNVLGIHLFPVEAAEVVPAGKHQVRMEFSYDGGGLAKGGTKFVQITRWLKSRSIWTACQSEELDLA